MMRPRCLGIMLLMVLYYRLSGLLADVALFLNVVLLPLGMILVAGFLAFPPAIPLAAAGQTGPGQPPPRAETLRVLFEGVEADFLRSERGFIQPVDIAQAAQVLVRTEEGPGAAYALTFTGRQRGAGIGPLRDGKVIKPSSAIAFSAAS